MRTAYIVVGMLIPDRLHDYFEATSLDSARRCIAVD